MTKWLNNQQVVVPFPLDSWRTNQDKEALIGPTGGAIQTASGEITTVSGMAAVAGVIRNVAGVIVTVADMDAAAAHTLAAAGLIAANTGMLAEASVGGLIDAFGLIAASSTVTAEATVYGIVTATGLISAHSNMDAAVEAGLRPVDWIFLDFDEAMISVEVLEDWIKVRKRDHVVIELGISSWLE